MAQRTGLPTLLKLAQEGCRLIAKFTPILQKLYGDNDLFMAALAGLNTACALFVLEGSAILPLGD